MRIGLFKPKGVLGKSVSFFTRGKYSHACIILNDDSVVESIALHGVRHCKSLRDIMDKKDAVDIYEVNTNEYADKIIVDFLLKQVGKKYDYWSVFGFVLFTHKESRPTRGKWFCSELVFASFRTAEIELLSRIHTWMVSPTLLSYSNKLTFVKTVTR
jgi:uncharacterized protein YycO